MAIKAALVNKNLAVTAKVTSTGTLVSSNPVTVKGFSARLDSLNDVDSTNEINGAVPVYDATTDKYVVKKIDAGDLGNLDVDGGIF